MKDKSFDALWSSYWLDVQRIGPLTHSRFRLLLAEVPAALPSKPRVMDVGCGSGVFLGMLLSRYPDADVQGIEISREARLAAPAALQPRILAGDILEVERDLARGSFDLIVCSEVLEHVPDPSAVIGVLRDLLKPGGTLLLTVPAGMVHWSVQDEAAGHLRRFEYGELSDLLHQQGLVLDHQYTWGGPIGTLYNSLISKLGPERAANAAGSALIRALAWMMRLALRLDDFFKSTNQFQLIARASRPIAP